MATLPFRMRGQFGTMLLLSLIPTSVKFVKLFKSFIVASRYNQHVGTAAMECGQTDAIRRMPMMGGTHA